MSRERDETERKQIFDQSMYQWTTRRYIIDNINTTLDNELVGIRTTYGLQAKNTSRRRNTKLTI